METVTQLILRERRIAYIVTNRDLKIVSIAGLVDILCEHAETYLGGELQALLPELVGSEEILHDILDGRLPRFQLSWINRDLPGGQTIYLSLVSLPLQDKSQAIRGVIQLVEDVTEAGTIEQRLAQQRNELRLLQTELARHNEELATANAQLDRASRAKDELLATTSHELRTPLTAILGFTEALQRDVYDPLQPGQYEAIRRIEASSRHLLSLINDILDVARIEAGKLSLDRNSVALVDLCMASIQMVTAEANRKHLHISTSFDRQVSIIEADGRRLQQILVNLLSNAVKFTPEHGAIGLEVRGDTISRLAHFTVWDTGIGIAPEDLARLFQPFTQVDSRLSRQYSGSGLGLTLSERLTRLHGGRLSVSSTPGKGSRFTVSLPWFDAYPLSEEGDAPWPDHQDVTPWPVAIAPPAVKILLAEDQEDNVAVLVDFLRSCGYQPAVTRDGRETLEYILAQPLDLVLMDIQMPHMDGLEVIRQVRANPATASLPIIALTALAMASDREFCLAAGASAYMSKPFSLAALADLIEALLSAREPDLPAAAVTERQRSVSGRNSR